MSKVTLDRNSFKALASDTRLNILKTLDGKKKNLKELSVETKLNKATLHEHLSKLTEAGLVKKKERKGHKWVYYKLSWKGESLLHPENTRIVLLFSATFISLAVGIIQLVNFLTNKTSDLFSQGGTGGVFSDKNNSEIVAPLNKTNNTVIDNTTKLPTDSGLYGGDPLGIAGPSQDPIFLYIAIACFILFTIVLAIALWRYRKNKIPKL